MDYTYELAGSYLSALGCISLVVFGLTLRLYSIITCQPANAPPLTRRQGITRIKPNPLLRTHPPHNLFITPPSFLIPHNIAPSLRRFGHTLSVSVLIDPLTHKHPSKWRQAGPRYMVTVNGHFPAFGVGLFLCLFTCRVGSLERQYILRDDAGQADHMVAEVVGAAVVPSRERRMEAFN